MKKLLLIIFLSICSSVLAESYTGISAYGLTNRHYPHKRFMRQFPEEIKKPAIAILPGSFGWNPVGVKLFNDRFFDRHRIIEIHFSNGCGRKHKRLERYELWYKQTHDNLNYNLEHKKRRTINALLLWTEKVNELLYDAIGNNTEKLHLFISVELEDKLTDKAYLVAKEIIRLNINYRIRFVRNKLTCCGNGGKYTEVHGDDYFHDHNFIYNLDGLSIDYGDGETYDNQIDLKHVPAWIKKRKKAKLLLLWSATQQGLKDGNYSPLRKRFKGKRPKEIITPKALKTNYELLNGIN